MIWPRDRETMAALGEKIARLRKARGWTQEIFASKMDVRQLQVSRWETGRMRPSGRTLQRMAEVLGMELDELLASDGAELVGQNPGMSEKINQLAQLDSQDRSMVFRLIDLLVMRQQMQKALVSAEQH